MKIKIGELARLATCATSTIRYYEKAGLLDRPGRTPTNYRMYDSEDVTRMRFIIQCRNNGLKLPEIRQLLAIRDNPPDGSSHARQIIAARLAAVDRQMETLQALKEELLALDARRAPSPDNDSYHAGEKE